MRITPGSMVLCVSLALAGCMNDGDLVDEPESGTTAQAITHSNGSQYNCPTGTCTFTVTNALNQMCFLRGVYGNLWGFGSVKVARGRGSSWVLTMQAPQNNNLRVTTECVTVAGPVTNVQFHTQTSQGGWGVYHGTSTSRCFLSEVTEGNGNAFNDFSTTFYIARTPGTNDLTMYPPSFPSGSEVTLGMQCAEIPSLVGDWAWGNGTNTTVTQPALITSGGSTKACGLTGIAGIFNTPSTSDGIEAQYSDPQWGWYISPWKGIYVECVQ
jgi:hypothetical protein